MTGVVDLSERQAVTPPPFTLGQLRAAIPAHCFERSTLRSSLYLARDIAFVAAVHVMGDYALNLAADTSPLAYAAVMMAYWILQGTCMMSIWIIAHECGHQAYSSRGIVNDTVGFFLHSYLLVPYFSWKYSHGRHHAKTGHLEEDEVFVPSQKSDFTLDPKVEVGPRHPLLTSLVVTAMLTIGWPLYLLFNVGGPNKWRTSSHFNPWAKMFHKEERMGVVISDLGVMAMTFILGYCAYHTSVWYVFSRYFVPYLLVNAWLVTITLLHHTDRRLPHYATGEWTYLRGAISTIDRNYGVMVNWALHNITDTHVVHHIFPKIPHYHAEEATAAIKPILGPHYMEDNETPFLVALWNCLARECIYVEESPNTRGLYWYKRYVDSKLD